MKAAQILIAMAWLVATVGVLVGFGGRTINLGFVIALAVALAAALSDWRALRLLSDRVLPRALGLGVLAFAVPAVVHGFSARLAWAAVRASAALIWLAFLLGPGHESAKKALPWAALALLVLNFVFACGSLWLPNDSGAYEIVHHEYVRGWPRFRGFANSPAPAGVWALVAMGLAEALPQQRLRWLTRALGLLEACASLSLALLAVPALLAALLPHRQLRAILVSCAAVSGAAILYFQPIELTVAGRPLVISRLHPSYAKEGLGPKYMPQKTLELPGLALRGHVTAYGKLAARGLTCFVEHPLVGVGPGRFREACRVMAMNTFGEWTDQRDSHNQLGGLLSELGLLGIAFLTAAWLALRSEYALQELGTWQRAVWLGLLICALGAEDLLTLPVLALLASQLQLRTVREEPLAHREGESSGVLS